MKVASALAAAAVALAALGCDTRADAPQRTVPVQTLENAPPRMSVIDPPRVLEERTVPAPALPSPDDPAATATAPNAAASTESEELKAKTNLPFTPPIAMDPVDGSKVSITPDTPVFSYQDRWYYFSSAANKAAFRANPEAYVKGSLARY